MPSPPRISGVGTRSTAGRSAESRGDRDRTPAPPRARTGMDPQTPRAVVDLQRRPVTTFDARPADGRPGLEPRRHLRLHTRGDVCDRSRPTPAPAPTTMDVD